jgi:hypothetical protein
MSEYNDLIEAGMSAFESAAGDTCTIQGKHYSCIFSSTSLSATLPDGGRLEGMDATALLRKSQKPQQPEIGQLFTVGSRTYMIEAVIDDGATWNLGLSSKH